MLQSKTTFLGKSIPLMRVSRALVAAEALDLLSTFVGYSLFPHIWEANPLQTQFGGWIPTLLFKVIAITVVVFILEKVEKWPRQVWIVPTVALLPAAWNVVVMFAELYVR